MAEQPESALAGLDLDTAIRLRWALRDIKASRTKLSPVNPGDLKILIEASLVEMRDDVPALTSAGERGARLELKAVHSTIVSRWTPAPWIPTLSQTADSQRADSHFCFHRFHNIFCTYAPSPARHQALLQRRVAPGQRRASRTNLKWSLRCWRPRNRPRSQLH